MSNFDIIATNNTDTYIKTVSDIVIKIFIKKLQNNRGYEKHVDSYD